MLATEQPCVDAYFTGLQMFGRNNGMAISTQDADATLITYVAQLASYQIHPSSSRFTRIHINSLRVINESAV